MKKSKGIIWGVVVILAGILWGVKEAGFLDYSIFFKGWWTLFIIIPCGINVFTQKNKLASLIGLFVGCLLFANYYVDLSRFEDYLFPLAVVLVGIGIVLRAVCAPKGNDEYQDEINQLGQPVINENGNQTYYATFSGQNLKYNQGFAGGKFVSTFGGMKLDITEADIVPNCVIEASATFGGVEIHVPQDVRVVVKSNSIFGGVSDKSNKNLPPDAKVIFVNSTNLFGGTDIK